MDCNIELSSGPLDGDANRKSRPSSEHIQIHKTGTQRNLHKILAKRRHLSHLPIRYHLDKFEFQVPVYVRCPVEHLIHIPSVGRM